MKAVILDGSNENEKMGVRLQAILHQQLAEKGWKIEHLLLREKKIGNCAGDFFCWVRSPGICNVDDDNRDIAKVIANSDLMVYLTPVTFGGYSSILKKAVDHQIQNISPFFDRIRGETHHKRRYEKYPDFLAVGWMEGEDQDAEKIFKQLVYRNSLNFFAHKVASGIINCDKSDSEIQASIEGYLDDLREGERLRLGDLPKNENLKLTSKKIQSALLLVGSPRTRKSTSNSLGEYLFEQLKRINIKTKTIYIHTSLRNPDRMKKLLEGMDAADLVVLAFPLYVDSLPAPVLEALERFVLYRDGKSTNQRFAAISNCGFPEPDHNATALAICANFAKQAGFKWAGSLALGAGQGMVRGQSLKEMDGRSVPLKQALDLAANALGRGLEIPPEAQKFWEKPFIPPWLYRTMGEYGWKRQAKLFGKQKQLKNQPYIQ